MFFRVLLVGFSLFRPGAARAPIEFSTKIYNKYYYKAYIYINKNYYYYISNLISLRVYRR
jgi:hypothetical protein